MFNNLIFKTRQIRNLENRSIAIFFIVCIISGLALVYLSSQIPSQSGQLASAVSDQTK